MLQTHAPARRCFLTPIPQLSSAADLLASAADCLLAGDAANARQLVAEADMPVIAAYTALVTGAVNPLVHWQSAMPCVGAEVERSDQRMPSSSSERAIYVRDGWRCRYCGTRVIDRIMRTRLNRCLPDVARAPTCNVGQAAIQSRPHAAVDHACAAISTPPTISHIDSALRTRWGHALRAALELSADGRHCRLPVHKRIH